MLRWILQPLHSSSSRATANRRRFAEGQNVPSSKAFCTGTYAAETHRWYPVRIDTVHATRHEGVAPRSIITTEHRPDARETQVQGSMSRARHAHECRGRYPTYSIPVHFGSFLTYRSVAWSVENAFSFLLKEFAFWSPLFH